MWAGGGGVGRNVFLMRNVVVTKMTDLETIFKKPWNLPCVYYYYTMSEIIWTWSKVRNARWLHNCVSSLYSGQCVTIGAWKSLIFLSLTAKIYIVFVLALHERIRDKLHTRLWSFLAKKMNDSIYPEAKWWAGVTSLGWSFFNSACFIIRVHVSSIELVQAVSHCKIVVVVLDDSRCEERCS